MNVGEQKETSLWVLFLGVFFALLVLAFSYVYLVDDAYISFRYSHNLAAGEGLVFNPGEYVEGSSSPGSASRGHSLSGDSTTTGPGFPTP